MSFGGFAGGANRIAVVVTSDSSQMRRDLKKAGKAGDDFTEKQTKQWGDLGKAIKIGFAVAAAAGLAKFVSSATAAASDLAEAQNAVNVVFKDSANLILGFGKVAAEQAGLSERAFNEMGANIGAILGNMIDDERLVATETINLAKRAADMASVMNTDVADAMNAIRSGLSGQVMPLRRYGVDLTTTVVKLHAVELGLADSTAEVGKQEEALARLSLIYEQTDKFAGDFLATVEEQANALRVLEAKQEDNAAVIGEKMLPAQILWQEAQIRVLEGLGRVIGWMDDEVEAANHLNAAFRALSEAQGDTNEVAIAFAEALAFLADRGGLTADVLELLAGASGLTAKEMIGLSTQALNLARAGESTERQLAAMEDAVVRNLRAAGLADDVYQGWIVTLGLGDAAARTSTESTSELTEVAEDYSHELRTLELQQEATTQAVLDAAEREKELADAMDDATAAAQGRYSALLNIHEPLFRLVELAEKLAEADAEILKAEHEIEQHSASATEFTDLYIERGRILADMQGILRRLREDGIDPTGEAARSMFVGMGIPTEVINQLFADFDLIEANLNAREFVVQVETFFRGERGPVTPVEPAPPRVYDRVGGGFVAHTGGRVNAPVGQEVDATLVGGEVVTNPAHDDSGGSPGLTVVQHFYRVEGDEEDLGRTAARGLLLSGVQRVIEQRRVR